MHNWKALVRERLGPLSIDPAREVDIVDELAQHVAQHHKDLVTSGVDDEKALALALAPLADRAAEEIARADKPRAAAPTPPASTDALFSGLARDIRYGARVLIKARGFTVVALISLGLAIGANTAIFSVVNSVLLRPLPYVDPDRLVMVGERTPDGSASNVGYTTFLDWRARSHSFEDMTLVRSWQTTLTASGEPERIAGMRVGWNFFRMLGAAPAIGRDFRAEEDTPATWRVVILSDGLWRRRFNADPTVIGRVLTMNDLPFTVIGVMPASFEPLISERYYKRAEMWAPVGYDRSLNYACRTCQHLKAIGRIKRGTSIDAARADIDAVGAALRREFPADYPPDAITAVSLQDELVGKVRPALLVLMGAVACVLLIACANVANLLLARMASRERDLALRAALGAGRGRLVQQLMVEHAMLAVAAGGVGIALCIGAMPVLAGLAPTEMARLTGSQVDVRVLGFSMLLSLATAFLFGLMPALRGSGIDPHGALQGDGRKTSSAPTSVARRVLVAATIAMAVVLLIGAGLMIKSVGHLLDVRPGFDPDRVLTLQISFSGRAYDQDDTVVAKTDEIVARLRALPGVESAAAAGQIPLGGNGDRWGFHVQGRPTGPDGPSVERYSVTPEYFSVMRIPLISGRLFSDADRKGTEDVMLVGEQTARTLWPGVSPLGQHVRIGGPTTGPWRTIVGIVGDVRHQELAAAPTMQMYTPQAQLTDSFLTIVVRSSIDSSTLAGAARHTIRSVASDIPIYEVAPLSTLVARSVGARRFVMILLEVFAAVAVLMTAIGVYGVISYSVTERTREIGIRAALGATPKDIVRLIVGSGIWIVSAGLIAGVVVALQATRLLSASLYEVPARDTATFVTITLFLFAVALVAQAVPIGRALKVDPTVALRQE